MSDKTLRKQVEAIKRQKIVSKKVVSLEEFRGVTKKSDPRSVLVVDDDEVMRTSQLSVVMNSFAPLVLSCARWLMAIALRSRW